VKNEAAITPSEIGMVLNSESYVPYYQQIVEQIRQLVKAGKSKEGKRPARRSM
jgi:DNA-binding transcriptional regulator YhcF (GntR family)